MKIKHATFWALARTKKQRMDMPSNCRCEIRASIGDFGSVSLALLVNDGDSSFAEISLSDCTEMKALANLLNATADAIIAQDA